MMDGGEIRWDPRRSFNESSEEERVGELLMTTLFPTRTQKSLTLPPEAVAVTRRAGPRPGFQNDNVRECN